MNTLLDIIAQDNTFELSEYRDKIVWVGKCIQCNRKLYITQEGNAISEATIEHIIPRCHGGSNEINNLAIACKGCNNYKGRTVDVQNRGHPKLEKTIASLQEKKQKRYRKI